MAVSPEKQLEAAIYSIENQTPDEVQRLRKLLCLSGGVLRGNPHKTMAEHLVIDAINREIGIDDLALRKFKNEFEKMEQS